MLDNHLYNLLEQMSQEHKSLWRIKRMYRKDARRCRECGMFWRSLEKDKEEHIASLKKLIQTHLR